MVDDNRSAKAVAGISAGAAILAAIALSQKVKAAPGGGIQLPQELWDLVIAIAASTASVDSDLDEVISAIKSLSLEGGMGWPANTNSGTALRVAIPIGGTQLPYIKVPSGMALFIKAWPLNPGWLHVGFSQAECLNINQSFPLLPTETVFYFIDNADEIYIAARAGGGGAPIAGCFACITVEQKKGGG